jgi:L-fucose isomerase-like protein
MPTKIHRPITLGVIVGNRDFFPDSLITTAREEIIQKLAELQIKPILLPLDATKLGGVETWEDAEKCAALFDEHRLFWLGYVLAWGVKAVGRVAPRPPEPPKPVELSFTT